MGIKGLWKELEGCAQQTTLAEFRGLRIGIDAFGWLHRAALPSAMNLAAGVPCDKYLAFFASRLDLLKHFGVTPVLVFDGRAVPMKEGTNDDRRERRARCREEGIALQQAGHFDKAAKCFEQAVDISHEMALSAVKLATERGICCVTAPYEADAQLGYLCSHGYIHGAISEDSDMLVYGCQLVIAKLDASGRCDALRMSQVLRSRNFAGLTHEQFILVCILSGCDYAPSLPGVGMRKATRVVQACRTIEACLEALREQCVGISFDEYSERVHKAYYCFRHHLVYAPSERVMRPFHPLRGDVQYEVDIIGPTADPATAQGICEKHALHPTSHQPFAADGLYRRCLDLYWTRVRGVGQRPMTAFGVTHAPRAAAATPAIIAAAPTHQRVGGGDSAALNGDADAFVSRAADRPSHVVPAGGRRVVSKYFVSSSASVVTAAATSVVAPSAASSASSIGSANASAAACAGGHASVFRHRLEALRATRHVEATARDDDAARLQQQSSDEHPRLQSGTDSALQSNGGCATKAGGGGSGIAFDSKENSSDSSDSSSGSDGIVPAVADCATTSTTNSFTAGASGNAVAVSDVASLRRLDHQQRAAAPATTTTSRAITGASSSITTANGRGTSSLRDIFRELACSAATPQRRPRESEHLHQPGARAARVVTMMAGNDDGGSRVRSGINTAVNDDDDDTMDDVAAADDGVAGRSRRDAYAYAHDDEKDDGGSIDGDADRDGDDADAPSDTHDNRLQQRHGQLPQQVRAKPDEAPLEQPGHRPDSSAPTKYVNPFLKMAIKPRIGLSRPVSAVFPTATTATTTTTTTITNAINSAATAGAGAAAARGGAVRFEGLMARLGFQH